MNLHNKKILLGVILTGGVVLAAQGLAQDIKFADIKPVTNQPILNDEQQGILAVRTAKTSVVDILGLPKPAGQLSSGQLGISAPSNESVSGTGFVIDAGGLVVTNNHVVNDNTLNYFVVLTDGTQYPAQILGQDPYDDVALLKISASGLIPMQLGDSSNLETGQTVFAIGNALGQYQDTVTRGVVSGLGRAINESGDTGSTPTTHGWIQTDAAINLGNSGGPLINMDGQAVGMDTLIDAQGTSLGFAIPINIVKDAVQQLKTFGKVSRPFLGVQFQTITPQLQTQDNLSVANGALIITVENGAPAAQAGLLPKDIVTSVNGVALSLVDELDAEVQKYPAGTQIILHILRGNQTLDLPVILGELK